MHGLEKLSKAVKKNISTGSTLEMDSGHKNNKTGFYPKCVRPFLTLQSARWVSQTQAIFFCIK